ncbi:MAG: two-component regulator propeller domain-containing protein, partial [Bacteroidota bacterium]
YVWAGTQGGGLSRFDGNTFKTYSDADGLPGNYIQTLFEDDRGTIYVGTSQGLATFDGQKFELGWTTESVLAIDEDQEDFGIVVLTDKYIQFAQKASWVELEFPKPYMRAYDLIVENGDLLLSTDQGVWRYTNSGWKELTAKYRGTHQVWSLFRYQRGQSWAVSPGGQLFTVRPDSLRPLRIPARIPTTFYISPEGDSWLGTQDQGVFCLPKGGQQWRNISTREGLASNHIRAISSDRWGNVWLGTSGGGLSCVRQAPFQAFDRSKGLAGKEVYAVSYDDSLGVIYSAGQRGVYRQTKQGPEQIYSTAEMGYPKIKSLQYDDEGRLWMGTPGKGIWIKTDTSLLRVKTCGQHVLDILQENDQQWWVATAYEGLSLLTLTEDSTGLKFSCRSFGREHELPIGRIESLAKDQQGRLLIAYRDLGVACWRPNELSWRLGRKDGLLSSNVRAIRQDSTGYFWLATSRGLARVGETSDGVQVKTFTSSDGLQSSNLYCLSLDKNNNLWVGSEKGVEQLVLDAARNIRQQTFYGQEEGFTGIETCTDAAFCDPEGNLWVGTMNGLMLHQDEPLQERQLPAPILHLSDMRVRYQSVRDSADWKVLDGWGELQTKQLSLNYRQNHLSFDLNALDLAQPKDILYQWQLQGWDEQWSLASPQSTATYANLSPGEYLFQARAIGEGDRQSKTLELAISIIPAYWQTSWFRTLVIGLLIAMFLGFLWWQFRKYKHRQERLAERLRLDNRLLELEQKALQLQMNPHFLANALQGIQNDLSKGDYQRASGYLTKFGELMRATLYHSRANRIPLSDEIENLRHYLDLERFRLNNRFDYQFIIPDEIEVDLIEIPPMLLQPFLENAVKHGIQTKAEDGLIRIEFIEEGQNVLLVRIRDNGQGLAASSAVKRAGHQSTALKVIQERLDLLGLNQQETPYQISEVVEDEQVLGVVVEVRLPVY